jgi:TBC1 domain family member 5
MSPTAATGASITMENRNLLNIPIDVPEPPSVPQRRAPPSSRERPGLVNRPNSDDARHRHVKQASSSSSQPGGISDMIAKGLLERGESLGINKTFMSAVSELRVCAIISI